MVHINGHIYLSPEESTIFFKDINFLRESKKYRVRSDSYTLFFLTQGERKILTQVKVKQNVYFKVQKLINNI